MAEIDDLFRRFQADLGPLPVASRRRILERARGGGRRAPSGRPRRVIAVVAGTACVAAITVAAFALRNADNGPSMAADAPRVSWGRLATIRVTPDAGVSMDTAMSRAATAIRRLSVDRDVPGVSVERAGSDTLQVRAPGAIDPISIQYLIPLGSIAVYNEATSGIASYTTVAAMKADAAPAAPSSGYLLLPTGGPISEGVWVATKSEATERLRSLNAGAGRRWEAIPTPRTGVRLVASQKSKRLDVMRDEPVLTGADIDAVEVAGTGMLKLTLTPGAQQRVAAALSQGRLVTTLRVTGPYSLAIGELVGATSGDFQIALALDQGTADRMVETISSTPVPAELKLVSSEAYGEQPPLTGDRVDPLPPAIDKQRREQWDPRADNPGHLEVPVTSVVRVLTTEHDGRKVAVYATRTAYGDTLVYGDMRIGEGNACSFWAGPSSLMACPTNFSSVNEGTLVGRIGDPTITDVIVTTRSGSYTAVVQNGWYLAFVPKGDVGHRISGGVKATGRNAKGDVIAELDLPSGKVRRHAEAPTATAPDPFTTTVAERTTGTPIRAFDGSTVHDENGNEVRLTEDEIFTTDVYALQVTDARRRGLDHLIPPRPSGTQTTSTVTTTGG